MILRIVSSFNLLSTPLIQAVSQLFLTTAQQNGVCKTYLGLMVQDILIRYWEKIVKWKI